MEEAEALSTKMGIMVRGGIFKCFGSQQHIKDKFGTGYEIEIKICKPTQVDLEELSESLGYSNSLLGDIEFSELREHCDGQVNDIILK